MQYECKLNVTVVTTEFKLAMKKLLSKSTARRVTNGLMTSDLVKVKSGAVSAVANRLLKRRKASEDRKKKSNKELQMSKSRCSRKLVNSLLSLQILMRR